jgi:DNA-binding LacI/PurR family transcriptional regulator
MSNVTLKDVAQKAGVSYQTVSKVLNSRHQFHQRIGSIVKVLVKLLSELL